MRKSESRVKTSPAVSISDSRTRHASASDMGRAGPDLSSFAKTFPIFGIVGQIFGQAFHRAGKVARQVVTRDCAGRRLFVQTLFEAFSHQPGFRYPPRPGLLAELSEEMVGQFHRNRAHDPRVI